MNPTLGVPASGLSSSRISFLASASSNHPPNRLRWSHFSYFIHPGRFRRPGKGPPLSPPGAQKRGSASFQAVSQTPIHLLPPSPGLLPGRGLSCGRRQRRNPAHHVSRQPPRQMALGQHQPVVPGILDQPWSISRAAPETVEMVPRGVFDVDQEPIIWENCPKVLQIKVEKRPARTDVRVNEFRPLKDCAGAEREEVSGLRPIFEVPGVDTGLRAGLEENLPRPCCVVGSRDRISEKRGARPWCSAAFFAGLC